MAATARHGIGGTVDVDHTESADRAIASSHRVGVATAQRRDRERSARFPGGPSRQTYTPPIYTTPGDEIARDPKARTPCRGGRSLVAGPWLLAAESAGAAAPAGDASVQVRIQDQDAAGEQDAGSWCRHHGHGRGWHRGRRRNHRRRRRAAHRGPAPAPNSSSWSTSRPFRRVRALLPDPNNGEDGPKRTVTIGAIGKGTKNLLIGEGRQSSESWVDRVPQRLVDGARLGLVIAITSVGLSLIFGTTGLTNFAHGEMVTFGGMTAFLLNVTLGPPVAARRPDRGRCSVGCSATSSTGGCGAGSEDAGSGLISQLVVSVGLSILLRNFFLYRFGGRTRPFGDFANQTQWTWWKIGITPRDLLDLGAARSSCSSRVALALQRTRLGKATRAVSDNVDLASATGIDAQKVIRLVWFVGGALAALGGIIRGLDEQVSFEMGSNLLFLMFAGITLGGLGSAFGALVGGFVVGVFTELLSLAVPTELKNVPPLMVLILVLLVRPQGILGRKERVG